MSRAIPILFTCTVMSGCMATDHDEGTWWTEGVVDSADPDMHVLTLPPGITFVHVKASVKSKQATDIHVHRIGGHEQCGGIRLELLPLDNETLCAFYNPGDADQSNPWRMDVTTNGSALVPYAIWIEWSTKPLDQIVEERRK